MLKNLLVHLTGTTPDAGVLATSKWVAEPFAAHLDCMHFRPSVGTLVAQAVGAGPNEDSAAITERFNAYQASVRERMRTAHRAFTEFCKKEGLPHAASPPAPDRVSATWREKVGSEVAEIAAEARTHDLTVVGGGGTAEGLSPRALGSLILAAGRPVLLAPDKPPADFLRTVAVAWKDSPESARAVTAAMPLLSAADRVIVLTANDENDKASECIDCSDSIAGNLRWHGLRAESRYVIPAGRSIPDSVVETAHEMNADLLVMGAYGRSRLSETVFGGFTQRVLGGVALPVFLFH